MDDQRRPVRFRELLQSLVDAEVDFIIVGGVAAVLEGVPISTFDLDLLYAPEASNLERLACVLDDLDAVYVDAAGRSVKPSAETLGRGGHHLLRTRHGRLDLLASIGDGLTYADLIDNCSTHEIQGMRVQSLPLKVLIATKEQAGRSKDRAVLDLLRATLAERDAER